jgi:hypothetical protein
MFAPHYDTMKKFVVANLMTAPEVTEKKKTNKPKKTPTHTMHPYTPPHTT